MQLLDREKLFHCGFIQLLYSLVVGKCNRNLLNQLYQEGSTNFNPVLSESISKLKASTETSEEKIGKMIILISDGGMLDELDDPLDEVLLTEAKKANIKIYTVGVGAEVNEEILHKIAEMTGGEYYYASTNKEISDLYTEIGVAKAKEIDMTDFDEDGLPDIFEIVGMQLQDGTVIHTDPDEPDTDGDGLLDGEEIIVHYNELTGTVTFTMISDPNLVDTDGDGLLDNYDPRTTKTVNNGDAMDAFREDAYRNYDTYNWINEMYNDPSVSHGNNTIEYYYEIYEVDVESALTTKKAITQIQQCLEFLKLLDMYEDGEKVSYGIFGGKTISALQLFQLNYGFEPIDNKNIDVDVYTYQTLLNVAVNYGFIVIDSSSSDNESEYINGNLLKKNNSNYKPYFSDIPSIKPTLSDSQRKEDIGVCQLNNAEYYDTMYCFDYTIPLEKLIDELSSEARLWHSISQTGLSEILMFVSKVNHGEEWDVKVQSSWEETIPNIKYYSQKFLFVFNGIVMNSENLGNYIYGCTGRACGLGMKMLTFGSEFASITGHTKDDETDIAFVQLGYDYYEIVAERNSW